MKQKLRLIYIDNDPVALELFRKLVETRTHLDYQGGFSSAIAGADFMRNNPVEIAILDIEMEDRNGLWLTEQVKDMSVGIVFLSTQSGDAIQAFEACALDFLQKPIKAQSLDECLARYRLREQKTRLYQLAQVEELFKRYLPTKEIPQRLFITLLGEVKVLQLKEIIYFLADESYTTIYLTNGDQLMVSKNLKTYEDSLKHHPDFIRIHRSTIINKNYVKSIMRDSAKKKISVIMSNEKSLEISYQKKDEILSYIAV